MQARGVALSTLTGTIGGAVRCACVCAASASMLACGSPSQEPVGPVPRVPADCGPAANLTDFQPIRVPPSTGATGTGGAGVEVTVFGARGDDQDDDTQAFQEALSSLPPQGGTVLIPPGLFLLRATPDEFNRAIELLGRTNVTIRGAGMQQTILRMAPASYRGDTFIVYMERVSGVTIEDLTIDGNRTNVNYQDEQSHGIEIRGSSNIRFENVMFTGMRSDGIRLLGLTGENRPVEQVLITHSRFDDNGRSGITIQRGVRELEVNNSTFTRISDQAIDMEPSNAEGDDIGPSDFVITNNVFVNTGGLAIAIAGVGVSKPARRIIVADNEFDGASLVVFNAHDVKIQRNSIRAKDRGPISVVKASRNVWILDNQIEYPTGAPGQAAIELAFHNGCAPTDFRLAGNTVQTGSARGVYARDSERLFITDNAFAGGGSDGILVEDISPGTPLADFVIESNEFEGYSVGIRFQSRGDLISRMCLLRNTFLNIADSLQTSGPVDSGCAAP